MGRLGMGERVWVRSWMGGAGLGLECVEMYQLLPDRKTCKAESKWDGSVGGVGGWIRIVGGA